MMLAPVTYDMGMMAFLCMTMKVTCSERVLLSFQHFFQSVGKDKFMLSE